MRADHRDFDAISPPRSEAAAAARGRSRRSVRRRRRARAPDRRDQAIRPCARDRDTLEGRPSPRTPEG